MAKLAACICSLLCLLLGQSFALSTTSAYDYDVLVKKWVVIVSGTQSYAGYGSEATACHLYHIARRGGIPAENIIHFNSDDVENSFENRGRHSLVNSFGGENLYPGCKIDYRHTRNDPDIFLGVITGNKTNTGLRSPKLLESGPNDHVFIALTGDGSSGTFSFRHDHLRAEEFMDALKTMHAKNMYSKMVIMMGSSKSGSMFRDLSDDMNIYAISSSKPDENSYNCCWDKKRSAYLGSYFFQAFTNATDSLDWNSLTFAQLYEKQKEACSNDEKSTSHPQQYGDTSLNQLVVADFLSKCKCPVCNNNQESEIVTVKSGRQVSEGETTTTSFLLSGKSAFVRKATLKDLVGRLTYLETELRDVRKQLEKFTES